MNQQEQFESWATNEDNENSPMWSVGAMRKSTDGYYEKLEVNEQFMAWKAAQAALIPHMEVLLADIQTVIAFGLFAPSPKLQEAIYFIKSATEDN